MPHAALALISTDIISIIATAMILGFLVLVFIPYWMILRKAGYSGWWSLLLFVPIVNIIAPWVFAFAEWPSLQKKGPVSY